MRGSRAQATVEEQRVRHSPTTRAAHSTGTAPTVSDRHSICPMAFTLLGNKTISSSTGSALRCSFNLWALKTLLTSDGHGLALPARSKQSLGGAHTWSALSLLIYHAAVGKLFPGRFSVGALQAASSPHPHQPWGCPSTVPCWILGFTRGIFFLHFLETWGILNCL